MKQVIDASVAAKWLAPEPDSALAQALLDHELIVPDLLFAEVANILWKKYSRGEMDAAATHIGVRWLAQVAFQVHECADLLADALALAIRLGHPAYDCFYLALACRVDVPFVTADTRFHARCRAADATGLGQRVQLLNPRVTP